MDDRALRGKMEAPQRNDATRASAWASLTGRASSHRPGPAGIVRSPNPRRGYVPASILQQNPEGDDDLGPVEQETPEPQTGIWEKILPQGMNAAEYFLYSPPASPEPEVPEPYEPEKFIKPAREIEDTPGWDSPSYFLFFFALCNNLDIALAKHRQFMRRPAVVRARFELGLPLTVPRPKIPVEDSFWDWMSLHTDPSIEVGECRIEFDIPRQLSYPDPETWYEALRGWYVRASQWQRTRQNELALVQLQIAADEMLDARATMQQEVARKHPPVRDVLEHIVPQRLAREVYAADRTAPPLLRHHIWWKYTVLPAPAGYDQRYSIIVHTNVDFIPPLPPSRGKEERIDERHGVLEASRFPQWHIIGRWWMAFIPTEEYGRVCENCEHQQLAPSTPGGAFPAMEFYRIDLAAHFVSRDEGKTFTPNAQLQSALETWWKRVCRDLAQLQITPELLAQRPYEVEQAGRSALTFLCSHALSPRHVRSCMVAWQRAVAELRGFVNYARSVVWLDGFMANNTRPVPIAADLRIRPFRKFTRGVFTDDEAVAALYAQHCVPVWLVQGNASLYWRAEPTVDHVAVSPPFACETRVYEGQEEWHQPVYLAARQEYWSPTVFARADKLQYAGGVHVPGPWSSVPPRTQPEQQSLPVNNQRGDRNYWDDEDDYYVGQANDFYDDRHAGSTAARGAGPVGTSAQKRKAEGPNESEGQHKKSKNRPASLKLAQGAKTKRVKEWPNWWPRKWEPARIAVDSTIVVEGSRMRTLQKDVEHPVPQGHGFTATFASPVLEHFAASANELNRSRLFSAYLMLRAKLLFALDTQTVRDVQRFPAGVWKRILSGHVPVDQQLAVAERLGFVFSSPPRIVDADDSTPTFQTVIKCRPSAEDDTSALPSTRESSPSSSVPQVPPSTAPTTRAASPDDEDDVDMTRIPRPGSPTAARSHRYFVPLDAPCDPPLELEESRYKKEPSGFRATGKGKPRAKSDFVWFVEEDSPTNTDDVLEFLEVSVKRANEYIDDEEDSDIWWDYEHHWIFVFREAPASHEGRVTGERLTQPLRMFQWAGSHSAAKYVHGTQEGTRQVRLWHGQTLIHPVYVPDAPMGPVGCHATPHPRDIEKKWYLPDNDYKAMFPTAPRCVAPSQIIVREERRGRKATPPASAPSAEVVQEGSAVPPPTALPEHAMEVDESPVKVDAHTVVGSAPTISAPEDATARPKFARPLQDALRGQTTMYFGDMALPPYDPETQEKSYSWPRDADRALIAWDIAELSFRLQLLELDDRLRTLHPESKKLTAQSNMERQAMICNIWQSETFIPRGPSALVESEWTSRIDAVLAFHKIVSTWPRVDIPEPPEVFQTQEAFTVFERAVWAAYARVHADYLYREAPVPLEMPPS